MQKESSKGCTGTVYISSSSGPHASLSSTVVAGVHMQVSGVHGWSLQANALSLPVWLFLSVISSQQSSFCSRIGGFGDQTANPGEKISLIVLAGMQGLQQWLVGACQQCSSPQVSSCWVLRSLQLRLLPFLFFWCPPLPPILPLLSALSSCIKRSGRKFVCHG